MAGKDLTLAELRKFDGSGDGGLIYVAINGKIFDVTEKGKQFYGPGGPYAAFAGHDASRGLATMTMGVKDDKDDLSDLTKAQMDSLKTWEAQFTGDHRRL
ncbi:hypothetical protein NP493_994g02027 [Ridgeia piscesae]|uniref:Cytochrome b5 heme-binding domain-containing protein n=1 Tax=Ridgeia piscesae TaxID=27915 RepID=A0AAD9NLZ6_RIDPI|nr:hypothetical protein NP493_994g02027 [Ridgeia piscesae]